MSEEVVSDALIESHLTERQRHWLSQCRAWEGSGKTAKAYAASEGLSVSALYAARRDLRQRGVWNGSVGRTKVSFRRVAVSRPSRSSSVWRIRLANGALLEWEVPEDPKQLATWLRVVCEQG